MDTSRENGLIHWGGIVGALGGIAWIVGVVLAAGRPAVTMQTYSPLMLAGLIAISIGLMAGHLRLRERTGLMGTLAMVLGVFSLLFMVTTWFLVEADIIKVVYFAFAFMLVMVSFGVFGLMGLASGGLSRLTLGLMMIGLLALPFMDLRTGVIWPGIVFGLAWVLLGIEMLVTRESYQTHTQAHA